MGAGIRKPSPSRTSVADGRYLPLGLKSSRPNVSARSAWRRGTAWRRVDQVDCSFAWVSCLQCRRWPPRRPTGTSAPSAPTSPTSASRHAAALSTMQTCRWQNASRPSRTGAVAPSTARITTARLPTTARPSSSARRTPGPLRTGVRLTRAKRTTTRPLRIAQRPSRSIRNMVGLQQPWCRLLRSA
jgi:hypothetical protein